MGANDGDGDGLRVGLAVGRTMGLVGAALGGTESIENGTVGWCGRHEVAAFSSTKSRSSVASQQFSTSDAVLRR